jgi:putative ABC transport system ATP-binding protein
MVNDALITTKHLIKRFPMGNEILTALDDVNITLHKGEFVGVVGPSGSGKTTLLNIIGALDDPSEGTAVVLGRDVRYLTHRQSADLRNQYIGFIFQTFNLLPVYTVYENVEFPLLLLGIPAGERKKAVMQALEWVGLIQKVNSRPAQLSGGEAQRVAVARAMVKNPVLVLADEPTANLDAANSHNILKMMVNLNWQLKTTFLFSTHDEKVVRYLRRVITLTDGRVTDDRLQEPQLS